MKLRTRCAILALPALSIALAADVPIEPRYDTATVANLEMVVVGTREAPKGNPLAGTHLMARLESARADSEALDIYLGPTDFIKQFDLTFHAGDRVQITGSKVKLAGAPVVLARELHRSDTTLYIRDAKGDPIWKYMVKGSS